MNSPDPSNPSLALRIGLPLPNLLETRVGRLAVFFLLYVTEGIPLGFSATAVATQMRRQGIGPTEIGVFVGTLYLPWAWKWLVGPFVDIFYSEKLGRRRAWIVATQVLMSLGLLYSMTVDFSTDLKFYTAIIVLVNIFGATQDVAIDALACTTLDASERGTANGLMFSGAYLGQALGGSGVLFLSERIGFSSAGLLAIASVLSITLFVALPLRETYVKSENSAPETDRLSEVGREVKTYVRQAVRSIFLTRNSLAAAAFALLPCGAMSLSLALASNLSVELGLADSEIATLTLISSVISAAGCVIGGFLSDRFGRNRMLVLYVLAMAIPVATMSYSMHVHGYVMPVDPTAPNRPPVATLLVTIFWITNIFFSASQGLMYGTRTALLMDVCDPEVAATQFTAYMSMMNLVIWYSSSWQGWAIESLGYPKTLALDAASGMLCLLLLPFIKPRDAGGTGPPSDSSHGSPRGEAQYRNPRMS